MKSLLIAVSFLTSLSAFASVTLGWDDERVLSSYHVEKIRSEGHLEANKAYLLILQNRSDFSICGTSALVDRESYEFDSQWSGTKEDKNIDSRLVIVPINGDFKVSARSSCIKTIDARLIDAFSDSPIFTEEKLVKDFDTTMVLLPNGEIIPPRKIKFDHGFKHSWF